MVTVKVESKEQMEFLQTAFEYVWNIIHCSVNDVFNIRMQVDALCIENQTIELTEKQAEVFRVVMQLYNDVIADDVEWSCDFIKQLPGTVKDAPAFHEALRDYHLDAFASDAYSLFKYWITQDWGYFNQELLDLIERTSSLDWFSVSHWCRRKNPSDTEIDDEIDYYKKEYCK